MNKEKNDQEYAVLNAINRVFKERIHCRDEEELAATCLALAEELTGSAFGFLGEINTCGLFDTLAISNPGWQECEISQAEARRLIRDMPLEGVDRGTMRDGASRIVNDPANHPEAGRAPKGHPEITCFLGVPFLEGGKVVGMVGLGNKEGGYTEADQEAVEHLSISIIESLKSFRTAERLQRQAEEILEVSTPIFQIWEGVVAAPLIGSLDSRRTDQFMTRLLQAIVETRSEVAIVDITGVPAVDTQTAQHLLETAAAVKLLGTKMVLTGVRPAIAQTLVHLGLDLAGMVTRSSMVAGLRVALEMLGLEVTAKNGQGATREVSG